MRNKHFSTFLLLFLSFFVLWTPTQAQTDSSSVLLIRADGIVAPAMAEYIVRGIRTAEQRGDNALIIQLNTPGGAIDTMNRIVQDIRASETPVIVYVAPAGAEAGSAGTVITLAGHLSAMAPETIIGAASPIGGGGEDIESTLESKIKEALKATVRSLMEGDAPEAIALAEDTIENAKAVTSTEAYEVGMIEILAVDLADLLQQADGQEVETVSGAQILDTGNAVVTELPASFIEQLLSILTNPNIAFILLTLGVQAVLIEIGSPGGWVAGFIGVSALTLAAFGLGVLGVNWLGLIFMAVAFVLFILEIKTPTLGALTAAGVGAFIVGALVLFNSPGTPSFARVSVPLVIGSGITIGASFALLLTFALRSQTVPVQMGQDALIGKIGRAQTDINPTGLVLLASEQWTAELEDGAEPVEARGRVLVTRVDGVRLYVRQAE